MTDHGVPAPMNHSTIRLDHRTSRSTYNAVLQPVVKMITPLLLFKEGHKQPEGSPELKPHKSAEKLCRITKTQVEGIWIYTFANPALRIDSEKSEKPKHNIYYFAGGGFRMPASKEQWTLCTEMCLKLPQYVVNLVSYPLAPNNEAPTSIPWLQRLYRKLASDAREKGTSITLMGDSSGGNIALSLGIYAATLFLESPTGSCPLRSIFAISPTTDMRHEHPGIAPLLSKDPVLTEKIISDSVDVWHGDWPVSDPRLSPILADLSVLRKANIKVDGVTGGYDILSPEAVLFRERLAEAGVSGDWLHWDKQMHCFPLTFSYHVSEAVAGKNWILDTLAANARPPSVSVS